MINLEQIRILESKVNKAVELIKVLTEENNALKATIDSSQTKMQELEQLVEEFKSDQDEIEKGILRALDNLEQLEDGLTHHEDDEKSAAGKPSTAETVPEPTAPQSASEEQELEIF
jgi:chromosome segregation ATPase